MLNRIMFAGIIGGILVANMSSSRAQSAAAVDSDEQVSDLLAEVSYRIVNGQLARDGAWPWQIAMYYRRSGGKFGQICGGSLIHRDWVLTAAHCIISRDAGDFMIVENTNRIDNPLKPGSRGNAIAVRQIIPHPAYKKSSQENDIALMRLAAPARSSPAVMASKADTAIEAPGYITTVTGWGTLRSISQGMDAVTHEVVRPGDPKYFTNRLMEVDLPLVDEKTCLAAYPGDKSIDQRALCAGFREGGKDSCQGDSGGPLVAKASNGQYKQVGVVSWGRGCARKESYGIYTRVSAFGSWISSTIGISFGASAPAPAAATSPAATKPPAAAPAQAQTPNLANNQAGVSVNFIQGDTLKVGQTANVKVATSQPGYLVLVDITPNGKATQIYPNGRSLSTPTGGRKSSNLVEPSTPLTVPDPKNPYEGFEFTIEPPTGEGKLVAVLSDQPLLSASSIPNLPKTMESVDAAVEFFSKLTEDLQRDVVIDGVKRKPNWSFATKAYRVTQ